MDAQYRDGYDEGYTAGLQTGNAMLIATADERDEERAKRLLVDSQRKTVLSLLSAAIRVIKAYGEDEGYSPSRVSEDVELLESARLL